MSEFLLVVPDGWTELDWQYITNNVPYMTYQDVINGARPDIEDRLKTAGIISPESYLLEFKLIDDTFFLIRLG